MPRQKKGKTEVKVHELKSNVVVHVRYIKKKYIICV